MQKLAWTKEALLLLRLPEFLSFFFLLPPKSITSTRPLVQLDRFVHFLPSIPVMRCRNTEGEQVFFWLLCLSLLLWLRVPETEEEEEELVTQL